MVVEGEQPVTGGGGASQSCGGRAAGRGSAVRTVTQVVEGVAGGCGCWRVAPHPQGDDHPGRGRVSCNAGRAVSRGVPGGTGGGGGGEGPAGGVSGGRRGRRGARRGRRRCAGGARRRG